MRVRHEDTYDEDELASMQRSNVRSHAVERSIPMSKSIILSAENMSWVLGGTGHEGQ